MKKKFLLFFFFIIFSCRDFYEISISKLELTAEEREKGLKGILEEFRPYLDAFSELKEEDEAFRPIIESFENLTKLSNESLVNLSEEDIAYYIETLKNIHDLISPTNIVPNKSFFENLNMYLFLRKKGGLDEKMEDLDEKISQIIELAKAIFGPFKEKVDSIKEAISNNSPETKIKARSQSKQKIEESSSRFFNLCLTIKDQIEALNFPDLLIRFVRLNDKPQNIAKNLEFLEAEFKQNSNLNLEELKKYIKKIESEKLISPPSKKSPFLGIFTTNPFVRNRKKSQTLPLKAQLPNKPQKHLRKSSSEPNFRTRLEINNLTLPPTIQEKKIRSSFYENADGLKSEFFESKENMSSPTSLRKRAASFFGHRK